MKHFFLISFLFLSIVSFSQKSNRSVPNFVEKKMAHFYKNSWKPFSGNVIVKDDSLQLTTKIKISNGFETLAELYDKNQKLVQRLINGIQVQLNETNQKSKFLNSEIYINQTEITSKYVLLNYFQDSKTKQKTKFNGIVKFDDVKIYYKNGEKIKIENYYDSEFKKIKESYEILRTGIGNLEFEDETSEYNGNYKIWNENGKIMEQGTYVEGKKMKTEK